MTIHTVAESLHSAEDLLTASRRELGPKWHAELMAGWGDDWRDAECSWVDGSED